MIRAVARRPACIIVAAWCLPGPLLCRAQGPACDGHALIQTEAVINRGAGEVVPGTQPVIGAAASGGELLLSKEKTAAAAQTATAPAAETRAGSGCEFGRDLLIASLDQLAMPGDFVEDDRTWAPLPTMRERLIGIKTAILDEPRVSPPVAHLAGWGRFCQVMPVFAVLALGFDKVYKSFARNTSSMSARTIIEVAASLVLYCVSGPAVILLNKHIMRAHMFHFPILLASLGNVFLMIVTRAAVASGWKKLEVDHLSWDRYLKVVVPINVFNFLTQALGMYAFLYISVPEIQVLKSTTIVMVTFFAWLLVNEKMSRLLISSVLVISVGVCTSAVFDSDSKVGGGRNVSHTLIGVTLMILASTFEAAKTVISQILMDKMPLFDGIYHSSPTFVLIAMVFVGCMEAKKLCHYDFNGMLVGLLVANAMTTGVIVLSSFWFVKLAGALNLKVVTQARSIGLILCSVFFFGEFCNGPQYAGYTVTVVGMGMFDYAKQLLIAQTGKDQRK